MIACGNNSIEEFQILSNFGVLVHPFRAPAIKDVIWEKSQLGWIKANIDGATKGSPGPARCGGMFRDHRGFNFRSFVIYICRVSSQKIRCMHIGNWIFITKV